MKNRFLSIAAAALVAVSVASAGYGAGVFDQHLAQDRQILQVLNRLTFGPRPGDVDEVRRIGLQKWIAMQLHPERIAENPVLEARLKPLETLQMGPAEVTKEYSVAPQAMMMAQTFVPLNTLLAPEDLRKVQNGTAEERTAVLKALDPEKRAKVLTLLPRNVLEFTPDFKKEADDAQKERQQQQQRENRKRNPQLNDLLTPEQVAIARNGNREQILALMDSVDIDKRPLLATVLPPQSMALVPELRRQGQMLRNPQGVVAEDLKEAKVYRAIYSNRQLEEVLVDFWYNHFNIDQNKNVPQANNALQMVVGNYERDAIRPHVLGHFKDLLLATARHPAMLLYLDNWSSVAPGAFEVGPFAPQRNLYNPNAQVYSPFSRVAHGLNENYGREIMELHTLGVKAGYTQTDVINVARCFTGWTVRSISDPEFVFAPFMHDYGEKIVLGHKIPAGGGEADGLKAIDILVHHPATARFISRELAQRFVSDDPPQALVDRMALTFTKTDGDLRAVLETMFASPEFLSQGAWQSKIKSPFEMVVSAVRAIGGDAIDAMPLVQKIADLGQPLYGKIDPNGYPNTGESWLSTSGIIGRMNFSNALASGHFPGVTLDAWNNVPQSAPDVSTVARNMLGRDVSPQTLEVVEKGLEGKSPTPSLIASLLLGSPDFQRR